MCKSFYVKWQYIKVPPKSRNAVAFRPAQKKLIKRYRNRRNATSVYYANRTSPLFDYLYLSHKNFPMNDFLHGL